MGKWEKTGQCQWYSKIITVVDQIIHSTHRIVLIQLGESPLLLPGLIADAHPLELANRIIQ